jgi:hypothetical protein
LDQCAIGLLNAGSRRASASRRKARGIELIAADSPSAFIDDTPTSKMIRKILGVIG